MNCTTCHEGQSSALVICPKCLEDMKTQLATVTREKNDAVTFIRHIDREYGRYINDDGFEKWRGPQEAGEVEHGD